MIKLRKVKVEKAKQISEDSQIGSSGVVVGEEGKKMSDLLAIFG